MKTLPTLVLLTLICFLVHSSAAGLVGVNLVTGTGCCLHHNRTMIPKGLVKHVGMSPGDCKLKAIVFTTVCNVTHCLDPSMLWAKKRLEEFQSSSKGFNQKACTEVKKQ
ncbi:C-C motif chemokine 17-like [Centropristis striata]|uniref:C-C motif chemokine 17-like n=1 Tax=Centropristis striata TaxID=184440 RepID=UPI0027DFA2E3|nr:C-C motif chemokine 17-like [Centropristis striata]XP_059212435.1 C-C motif chemokine 17-like [Centropristis striata]